MFAALSRSLTESPIRAALASILRNLDPSLAGLDDAHDATDPETGDLMVSFRRADTLSLLTALENTDPETYLDALRHFGPHAAVFIAQNVAGHQGTKELVGFRMAFLRLVHPEIGPNEAATLCDPASSFRGQTRLAHSNPQMDANSGFIDPAIAYLSGGPDAPPSFPDSRDSLVAVFMCGTLAYGGGRSIVTERVLDLIDGALQILEEKNAATEGVLTLGDADKIRIGTLLAVGGAALVGNGVSIFRDDTGNRPSLTLVDMLNNSAKYFRMRNRTDSDPMTPLLDRIHDLADLRPELCDILYHPLKTVEAVQRTALRGKIREALDGLPSETPSLPLQTQYGPHL